MDEEASLREHVVKLLTARQAHCTFEDAVAQMPAGRRGERPDSLPFSAWELVEHMRRAQKDILLYCQDEAYEQPDWPSDYWPDESAPASSSAWEESCAAVQEDLDALCALARDESIDLYDTVPASDEHTYLREFLLVADHNAYHVGQLVTLRRQLDLWPPAADHT